MKWLNNPTNLAAAKDDVPGLSAIEEAVKVQQQDGESSWFQFLRSAGAGAEKSIAGLFRIPGIATTLAKQGVEQLGNDPGPVGQTLNQLSGNNLPEITKALTDWKNPDWLNTWFGASTAMNRQADLYSGVTNDGDSIAAELNKRDAAGVVRQGLLQLIPMLPTIAAGVVDPALGLSLGAGSSAGTQDQIDLDNGKTPYDAATDALLNGTINAAGMKAGGSIAQLERMKALFSSPVARETISQLFGRIARQSVIRATTQGVPTQAAIQVGDDAADYATGNKHALDNELQKATIAGILGFVADGAIAAPMGALEGLRQISTQKTGQAAWTKLTQAVSQSKLTQRDPNAAADFVDSTLAAHNQPPTLNVDADKLTTYFQTRPPADLKNFASDMNLKPEDITNAAATGGTVDLPKGAYAAKYVGGDLDKAISQDLRFTPGGASQSEIDALSQQMQGLHDDIANRIQSTAVSEDSGELPSQIKAMRDQLMADKNSGGMGYSADQADSQLSVLMAGLRHSVAQPGESLADTVNRIGLGLQVGGEAPDGNTNAKGAVSFGNGKTMIHLLKGADLSTFLHESGHIFLNQRQKMIDQGIATPQAIADHQTLHEFAGVKPGEKPTTEQTEKIVNGFEGYLREGKAPSIELSGPFARFRSWIANVYRSTTALGAQPTDEVRQVFDRMLASEDDIAHAQEYYSRTADVLNSIKADEAAKQPVRDQLAEVKQSQLDKQTNAYLKSYVKAVGGVSKIREAAKEKVEDEPTYKALDDAKVGGFDEASLREHLGSKAFKDFVKIFPKLVRENGVHTLESLAAKHGFDSPESLSDHLMSSVPKAEAITNYTKRLIAEKEQQLRDEIVKRGATPADGVMHTDGSLAYLIAETNLMARQLNRGQGVSLRAAVYRDAAKQAIGDMKVRKAIRYSDFAKTEARLGKQVVDMAKKGLWEDSAPNKDGKITHGALTLRKKQIAQHAMVQEAIKARDERFDITKRYSPSNLESKLKGVDNEYLDPIRQILSTYGLSGVKPKTPYDLHQLGDIDVVMASQIPTWIINGENAGDFRDLTFSQLQDVDAAVKSLMSFGNDQRKSDLAIEQKTIKDMAEKGVALTAKLPERNPRQLDGSITGNAYTKMLQGIDWLKSHVTKTQFLFKILDGFHDDMHTKLFEGVREAEANQSEAQRVVHEDAHPHLRTLVDATTRLRKEYGERFPVEGVDKPEIYNEKGLANWSPEELVAYMLNTGAEGNIAALKNAFGHGAPEFDRVAQLFTADELQAVDGLRDAIDPLYEPLNETNFKLYNRNVEKVDAVPQDLTDNEGKPVHLKGGYWPLIFDHEINRLQGKKSEEDVLKGNIASFLRSARPEDGMTKSRVLGHSLSPRLDMGVFGDHVDNTTRFIHMAPLLRDLDRMMQNPDWRSAVISKVGINEYNQARDWLRYQANPGYKQTNDFMRGVDKIADYLRVVATKGALGLNLIAGIKWRTSMLNSAKELGGWRHVFNGYLGLGTKGLGTATLGLSNTETWHMIEEKSAYLKARESKGIRDIRNDVEALKWNHFEMKIPGTDKTLDKHDFNNVLYGWAKMNDRAVVAPVWMGGYMKYLNEMGAPEETPEEKEKNAIAYADSVVQKSQPSSLNVDLNSSQRNQSAVAKLVTMFMSYPFTIANRFNYYAKALAAGQISKAEYVNHFMLEVMLEPMARVMISAAALGTLPSAAKLALAPVNNVMSMIPGVSAAWNAILNDFDPSEVSPALDVLKKGKNVSDDVLKNKDVPKIVWDVARLTGYLTGIPALNIVKTLLDFDAESKGEKNPYK